MIQLFYLTLILFTINLIPVSTGQVYSLIPDSEASDINNAVIAAKEAFKTWSITPKQERSDILMKLADTIEKYSEDLVKADTSVKAGVSPPSGSYYSFDYEGLTTISTQALIDLTKRVQTLKNRISALEN